MSNGTYLVEKYLLVCWYTYISISSIIHSLYWYILSYSKNVTCSYRCYFSIP